MWIVWFYELRKARLKIEIVDKKKKKTYKKIIVPDWENEGPFGNRNCFEWILENRGLKADYYRRERGHDTGQGEKRKEWEKD